MANILNCYAIFFTKLGAVESRAEAFGSRSPKLKRMNWLFESTKFEKVKGSKLSVYKRNILVI